jgi:hypothetical protein
MWQKNGDARFLACMGFMVVTFLRPHLDPATPSSPSATSSSYSSSFDLLFFDFEGFSDFMKSDALQLMQCRLLLRFVSFPFS